MESRPLVIVGSGPAGTATALYLQRLAPALAREIVLLDKAEHPREKVCAGGLIPHAVEALGELGVPLDVPHAVVRRAEVRIPGGSVTYRADELCRVVRRAEFDASLVRACRSRGIEVQERERVVDVARDGDVVRVETEQRSYAARAVVGADGSGSIVRRRLLAAHAAHTGRAIMCDIPVAECAWGGFAEERYDFSFAAVADGLQGYAWAFPCLIGGVPHVNLGVYSLHPQGRPLYDVLAREAGRIGAAVGRVKAFPIRWYHRREPLAARGVALVGDAAGVDPLMGEGISYCFEYGRLAASALAAGFASGDVSLAEYPGAVHRSWTGRKLRRLGWGARLFYGPAWRLCFGFAAHHPRAQDIGVRWYNGVGGWDRADLWTAARAFWRGDLAIEPAAQS